MWPLSNEKLNLIFSLLLVEFLCHELFRDVLNLAAMNLYMTLGPSFNTTQKYVSCVSCLKFIYKILSIFLLPLF